jgi:hypothetical protein
MRRFLLLFALAQCASAEPDDNAFTPLRLEETFRLRLEPDRTYVFGKWESRGLTVVKKAVNDNITFPPSVITDQPRNHRLDAPGPGYRLQAGKLELSN